MFKTFFAPKRGTDNDMPLLSQLSRRKFLGVAGVGASALTIASCGKDNNDDMGVDLGSGDVGILNYAYALEQLEAAFYTRVTASIYTGATTTETNYLNDIRDHEIAHRDFFRQAITAAGATPLPPLTFNLSSIDFTSRTSVLGAAQTFEDLGVAAYNGAGRLITNAAYLLIAGKIVSVEARHAAIIRDFVSASSGTFTFAATTDTNGLDPALTPPQVMAAAGAYISTKLNASNLPTS